MKKQKDEGESGARSLSESKELAEDIFRDALGELKGKGPESGKEPEGSPRPPDVKTQGTTDKKPLPGPRKNAPAPSREAKERAEGKEKAPLKASEAGISHAGDSKNGTSKANAGAVETDKGPVETVDRPSGKRGILLICLVAGIVAVAAGAGIYIYGNVNLGEKGLPEVNVAPKEIVKDSGASKGAIVRREIERPPSGETAVSRVPEDRKIQDVAQVEPDRPVPDREQAAIAPSIKEEKQDLREGSGARDSAAGQKVEEVTVKTSEKSKPGPAAKKVEPVSGRAVVSYPFSIQMDSMSTREGADKAVEEYRKKGLDAYWVKVDLGRKGVWFRVFVGNFKDGETAGQIITKKGLSGATVKRTMYAVLTGTCSSNEEMRRHLEAASGLGFSPYVISGDKGEFMIYVGAFSSRERAELQSRELSSRGIPGRVVER